MYRVAICDDVEQDLQSMTAVTAMLLTNEGIPHEIERFHTAEQLLEIRNRDTSWDLILMDIMMEGRNGIEVAEALRSCGDETDLIFVTRSPEYALAGYRVYPVHYLLKPLMPETLAPVLSRCLERRQKLPLLVLDAIEGGKITLPLGEIRYIEVLRRELVVHAKHHNISCAGPLNAIMEKLPTENFYHCHRSYVVNLAQVSGIRKYYFLLRGGEEVPIAMRPFPEAQERWLDFLK